MTPLTKTARQAQIADILARARVRSQEELAELLSGRGVRVTQATLSRDLEELGAVRLRGAGGILVYALPDTPGGPGSRPGGHMTGGDAAAPADPLAQGGEDEPAVPPRSRRSRRLPDGSLDVAGLGTLGSLTRIAPELLVSAEASANLVVVRTPAGGAQLLASAIDHAGWTSILGTVAGDDTVLVITRDPLGGGDVARELIRIAERRPAADPAPGT